MVWTFLVALSGLIIAVIGAAWLTAADQPQGADAAIEDWASAERAFRMPLDD